MQQHARRAVIAAARDYLQAAGEPLPPHHPLVFSWRGIARVFHPGVWVKNSRFHGLAKKYGLSDQPR